MRPTTLRERPSHELPTDRSEPPPTPRRGGFRPEIVGLRAIAVLLVAIYHIWFGRVSGGVDVFLLLTGFLITGSLLRMAQPHGRVRFAAFWSRLFKRLFPPVAVVLLSVLVATYLWLPRARWRGTIEETIAAALYLENWALATKAVDYLDRTELPSPVQHIWSLSMQGQFYLVWAVLMALAAFFATRLRRDVAKVWLVLCATVFVGSLSYSVFITESNQAWAYFDFGARLWEFALGGLLAVVLPYLRLPERLRVALGWLGLLALISCGALLDVSTMFPGYVALWPVGAAILVLLAGTTGNRFGADRLLTSRPLKSLGDLSYALYLWHWPVLVVYLAVTDRSVASLHGGLAVLAVSLLLAVLTRTLLEKPVNAFTHSRSGVGWAITVVAFFLTPVLVVTALWTTRLDREQHLAASAADNVALYPGARVLVQPELADHSSSPPVRPDLANARADLPDTYEKGCHATLEQTEAVVCEHGPDNAEHSIAVVGASRSAHWYPALREVADANGWKLYNITKSSCQFSTDTPLTTDGQVYSECLEWRENLMRELTELRPDVVLTSSTRATPDQGEQTFPGFVERWRQLDELGIDVIGVRDLPRVEAEGAECLSRRTAEECTSPVSYSHAPTDPALELTGVPDNVTFIDMTPYVCPEGECPPVIGNVLVYYDDAHLTATYSRTLAPLLEDEIVRATNW